MTVPRLKRSIVISGFAAQEILQSLNKHLPDVVRHILYGVGFLRIDLVEGVLRHDNKAGFAILGDGDWAQGGCMQHVASTAGEFSFFVLLGRVLYNRNRYYD